MTDRESQGQRTEIEVSKRKSELLTDTLRGSPFDRICNRNRRFYFSEPASSPSTEMISVSFFFLCNRERDKVLDYMRSLRVHTTERGP